MAEDSSGRIYAQALFNVARGEKAVEECGSALQRLAAVVAGNPDFRLFLAAPTVPPARKTAAVEAVASALRLPGPVAGIFRLAVKRRRTAVLAAASREYRVLEDESRRRVDVTVETAEALNETEKSRLETAVKRRLDREPRIEYRLVPGLLAGLVVRAGGKVFDCSLSGRLKRLEERMLCRER
ncbi:MAG TPA: ATP synthase F1 subunit delta [bacterium]|nr:ATP synthase F1 subunit delta [bacterium]HPJ71345.1 ATP synthase F1 subunit delta [bacterium]HPQ65278.1 ATP synthase F1 subunit delta [bacterium]